MKILLSESQLEFIKKREIINEIVLAQPDLKIDSLVMIPSDKFNIRLNDPSDPSSFTTVNIILVNGRIGNCEVEENNTDFNDEDIIKRVYFLSDRGLFKMFPKNMNWDFITGDLKKD